MDYHIDKLEYSLAKQVPDMEGGFTIATNYGDISVPADQALPIARQIRKILERQLKAEKKAKETL